MWIAGVDEAGRGPLAGPVVAAAVILDPDKPIHGLMDSKMLSEKKREALFEEIQAKARSFAIAKADVMEIDALNILQASLLAMQRAVLALNLEPTAVWVDGNKAPILPYPVTPIVRGDALVPAISAASILAKVSRDREMQSWHRHYPQYDLHLHKGYPTAAHVALLQKWGPCPLHRRSFAPVRAAALAFEVE